MSGETPSIPENPPRTAAADTNFPSSRLVVFLGPVLAVGAFTATLATVAALLGFHREEMLLAAAGVGCTAVLPAVFLLYRQVADRQATWRELQNVQARVGGVVESAMDAIITIDEEQRVVQFNAAAERAFRWPRAVVIGQHLDMLIPKHFRAAHGGHIERFGRTSTTSRGMGAQTVLHGLRADGVEFPLEASISQYSEQGRKLFTVILRDVTDRVNSEEMRARSEARLRGILDSAMDAIITVDERQHIVLFNAAAEKVFGCGRDEAIGAPLAWFIPDRFRDAHAEHLRQFAVTGTSSRRMGMQRIVLGLRRNGEEFPIDASISQISEHGRRFFTVILRDVTERTRQDEALRDSREEIRALALAAQDLREQEKRRTARELHDELGQALTALKLEVGWMKDRVGAGDDAFARKLESMQVLLDGTVAATRRISADLRPLVLDDLGLAAGVDWLAQNFTNRTGVACELTLGHGFDDLPDPHATTIFRVLQEALTNVAKHARASRAEVELSMERGSMRLVVRDDGRGFASDAPRSPSSYGLLGMRERAYLLGGEVLLESAPGQGTIVEMRLPHRAAGAGP